MSPYGAARARMAAHACTPAPKRPGADVASRRKILAKIRRFLASFQPIRWSVTRFACSPG